MQVALLGLNLHCDWSVGYGTLSVTVPLLISDHSVMSAYTHILTRTSSLVPHRHMSAPHNHS